MRVAHFPRRPAPDDVSTTPDDVGPAFGDVGPAPDDVYRYVRASASGRRRIVGGARCPDHHLYAAYISSAADLAVWIAKLADAGDHNEDYVGFQTTD